MSFYGDIKRVQSSPYVFDKYYPNRYYMEQEAASDGVYIGRYVLIKYTCKYKNQSYSGTGTLPEIPNDKTLQYFNKYVADNSASSGKRISDYYNVNANIDKSGARINGFNGYKDTFDGTVWQKIYSQGIEKYIMVAELNAAVPRIELDVVNPKYFYNNQEQWKVPEIVEIASSEDAYTFKMPKPLKLSVDSFTTDCYAGNLLDPRERKILTLPENKTAFDPEYNCVGWKNFLNNEEQNNTNNGAEIDEKRLTMKFYAFGQMISDLYDVMYGVPKTQTGSRPFFTDNLSSVVPKYDKGLVGILTSIATDYKGNISYDSYGRRMNPGLYYYFFSKWGDATEDPNNFIENIPQVIGSREERGAGKAHYRINFDSGKLVTNS